MTLDIGTAVPQIFSESQRSVAGHRKGAAALRKLHDQTAKTGRSGEKEFNAEFVRNLNKVLPIRKGQVVADRIIKFVAEYLKFILEKEKDVADATSPGADSDSLSFRFVTFLMQYLLKGVTAKDKNVRMRISQLLAESVGVLQEIDEDLFLQLKGKVFAMLKEKDATIRVQAVRAFAGLQFIESENDRGTSASKTLGKMLSRDPSAEVRRTIISLIVLDSSTRNVVLERLRDVDAGVRKGVFARFLEVAPEGLEELSLEQRERLFNLGLKDREASVNKACISLLTSWLNSAAEGSIERLLQMLDVTNTSVAEEVTKALINVTPKFSMTCDEAFWDSLSGESVFLLRAYGQILVENNQELPEGVFPSLSDLVGHIQRYHSLRLAATSDEDVIVVDFIVSELLRLALILDYADEVGRKSLLTFLRDMCLEPDLSDSHVPLIVEVIAKTATSGRDFGRVVVELIKDIMDFENDEEVDEASAEQYQLQRLLSIVKSLVILRCALEQTEEMLSSMPTLGAQLTDLVVPAITSEDVTLKDLGLHCLSLYCTIDRELAVRNVATFVDIGKSDSSFASLCVKTVCDLLALHSLAPFGEELAKSATSFLVSSVDDADDQISVPAVEGLAKLLLVGIIDDSSILEKLALVYFDTSGTRQHKSRERQCLSFFFETYSHLSPPNQRKVGRIVGPVFKRLLRDTESWETGITPSQIGLQMISWTDSSRLAPTSKHPKDEKELKGDPHGQVAVDLLKLAYKDSSNVKLIAQLLTKLNVNAAWSRENLEKATILLGNVRKLVSDVTSTNNLKKFASVLDDVQEHLPPLDENENAEREQWNADLEAFCDAEESRTKDLRRTNAKKQVVEQSRQAKSSKRRTVVESDDSDSSGDEDERVEETDVETEDDIEDDE
ncbi:hypothetical protein M427DRAFT_121059 [Gonapodya prolifera JEL478]|uniref:Death domain-containing protein n=1 Tax=Gonapodya prolifera (strain JEL478) TaxID=1344416 RepID=A0A139APF9_GONPJ|nr:hypothetical protein M427DRAFT_121059 [Gonapodya prolifera JEL478]|eukprot:KXS18626.1 hypothetical protein M427DRAFT_121059 [Gonapodya prolifera JEL478]